MSDDGQTFLKDIYIFDKIIDKIGFLRSDRQPTQFNAVQPLPFLDQCYLPLSWVTQETALSRTNINLGEREVTLVFLGKYTRGGVWNLYWPMVSSIFV